MDPEDVLTRRTSTYYKNSMIKPSYSRGMARYVREQLLNGHDVDINEVSTSFDTGTNAIYQVFSNLRKDGRVIVKVSKGVFRNPVAYRDRFESKLIKDDTNVVDATIEKKPRKKRRTKEQMMKQVGEVDLPEAVNEPYVVGCHKVSLDTRRDALGLRITCELVIDDNPSRDVHRLIKDLNQLMMEHTQLSLPK